VIREHVGVFGATPRRSGIVMAFTLLASFACPTSFASAQAPCEDLGTDCPEAANAESARGIGLGTGVRASSMSTSALAYSPAALAIGSLYHIEGQVDYISQAQGVALGAAVVDSSTTRLGAGIGLRGFVSGDDGWSGLDGRVGLAYPLSDAFAVGLAGRYITLSQDFIDEDGERYSATLAEGITMDGSIRISPGSGLQIDLAALNFIDRDSEYVPVTLATAVAFAVNEQMALGVDFLTDMSTFDKPKFILGGGGEFFAAGSVPLRGGYAYDTGRKIHMLSGGIGYTDRQIGLDISLRQQIATADGRDKETRVMGAFRYYVQ
jgi:hypothetical protein